MSLILCQCGELASWNTHFKSYICEKCRKRIQPLSSHAMLGEVAKLTNEYIFQNCIVQSDNMIDMTVEKLEHFANYLIIELNK